MGLRYGTQRKKAPVWEAHKQVYFFERRWLRGPGLVTTLHIIFAAPRCMKWDFLACSSTPLT